MHSIWFWINWKEKIRPWADWGEQILNFKLDGLIKARVMHRALSYDGIFHLAAWSQEDLMSGFEEHDQTSKEFTKLCAGMYRSRSFFFGCFGSGKRESAKKAKFAINPVFQCGSIYGGQWGKNGRK